MKTRIDAIVRGSSVLDICAMEPMEMRYKMQRKHIGTPFVNVILKNGSSIIIRSVMREISDRNEVGVLHIEYFTSSEVPDIYQEYDLSTDIDGSYICIMSIDIDTFSIETGVRFCKNDGCFTIIPSVSPESLVVMPPEDPDLISGPYYHGPEYDIGMYYTNSRC